MNGSQTLFPTKGGLPPALRVAEGRAFPPGASGGSDNLSFRKQTDLPTGSVTDVVVSPVSLGRGILNPNLSLGFELGALNDDYLKSTTREKRRWGKKEERKKFLKTSPLKRVSNQKFKKKICAKKNK